MLIVDVEAKRLSCKQWISLIVAFVNEVNLLVNPVLGWIRSNAKSFLSLFLQIVLHSCCLNGFKYEVGRTVFWRGFDFDWPFYQFGTPCWLPKLSWPKTPLSKAEYWCWVIFHVSFNLVFAQRAGQFEAMGHSGGCS